MDMKTEKNNNDLLIRTYLHTHSGRVEDAGFSRRVMRHLPESHGFLPYGLRVMGVGMLCAVLLYVTRDQWMYGFSHRLLALLGTDLFYHLSPQLCVVLAVSIATCSYIVWDNR